MGCLLCGSFLKENWPRYNGTALYIFTCLPICEQSVDRWGDWCHHCVPPSKIQVYVYIASTWKEASLTPDCIKTRNRFLERIKNLYINLYEIMKCMRYLTHFLLDCFQETVKHNYMFLLLTRLWIDDIFSSREKRETARCYNANAMAANTPGRCATMVFS